MRKVGFILLYTAVAMIGFGIGWMIEENLEKKIEEKIKKDICDTTTNIEWYIKNDCMKYHKNS